jgi:hypothetical protein
MPKILDANHFINQEVFGIQDRKKPNWGNLTFWASDHRHLTPETYRSQS